MLKLNGEINRKCDALGIEHKGGILPVAIFGALYLNLVSLSVLQNKLNKIADADAKAEVTEKVEA